MAKCKPCDDSCSYRDCPYHPHFIKPDWLSSRKMSCNKNKILMKARNIRLTLEKAKEWFKLGGVLRRIALQAFNQEELSEAHISLLRDNFIVEAEGKKLCVSYDEFHGNHENAMTFCKEHNGGDETIENIHIISKYRDDINKELRTLGKTPIEGWYWTNKTAWAHNNCAFVVYTDFGSVSNVYRNLSSNARAVSAL